MRGHQTWGAAQGAGRALGSGASAELARGCIRGGHQGSKAPAAGGRGLMPRVLCLGALPSAAAPSKGFGKLMGRHLVVGIAYIHTGPGAAKQHGGESMQRHALRSAPITAHTYNPGEVPPLSTPPVEKLAKRAAGIDLFAE
jgi:hypothetical protein